MKKSTALHRSIFTVMTMALLISACSTNPPSNVVNVGPTSTPTPTGVNGSSNNGATAAIIPVDTPSPAALTPVPNVDICSLITTAEAEPFVETALIDVTPGGDIDEVTGGPLDHCTYKGDDIALVISVVKSGAPEGSQEWQNLLLLMAQATDPEAGITPGTDLGERSYWVVTEESAGWTVAEYPYVFALAVGGNIGYSEDYKEDLKALAHKVLDALP
jgi:hypothetical protein